EGMPSPATSTLSPSNELARAGKRRGRIRTSWPNIGYRRRRRQPERRPRRDRRARRREWLRQVNTRQSRRWVGAGAKRRDPLRRNPRRTPPPAGSPPRVTAATDGVPKPVFVA